MFMLLGWVGVSVSLLNIHPTLTPSHRLKAIRKMHLLFECFDRTDRFLHIASFDFTPIHRYDHRFLHPCSK